MTVKPINTATDTRNRYAYREARANRSGDSAQVMEEIAGWMKKASVTQAAAAEVLHVTRPGASDVSMTRSTDLRSMHRLAWWRGIGKQEHLSVLSA
jgi:predicted XRE-type DNA-binding protein